MANPFFDHPILNSPYESPPRHWELDEHGQPTQQIVGSDKTAALLAVALMFDLPVKDVRRVWRAKDHELTGPYWEMTFRHPATPDDHVRLGHAPDPRTPHNPIRRATFRPARRGVR